MVIELTAEEEAQLLEIAAGAEKSAEELAHDVLSQAIAARHKFVTAVQKGLASAERGEFVESAEVWARVEKILQR